MVQPNLYRARPNKDYLLVLRDDPVLAHCVPIADISSSQLERDPLRLAGTQLDVVEPTENTKRILFTSELDVLECKCQFVCPRYLKAGQGKKRGGVEEGSLRTSMIHIYKLTSWGISVPANFPVFLIENEIVYTTS